MTRPTQTGEGRPAGTADLLDEDEASRLHERRRLRTPLMIVLAGFLMGLVAAGGVGSQTQDGRAAFAVLLLATTLGTAVAGLHTGLRLLVDDLRRRPTSLRRGLLAVALFTLTAGQMAALAGIGG